MSVTNNKCKNVINLLAMGGRVGINMSICGTFKKNVMINACMLAIESARFKINSVLANLK